MNFKQAVVVGVVLGFSLTILGFIGDGSRPDMAERKAQVVAIGAGNVGG